LTRITNADQVLLLLRSHLQRTERLRKSNKTTDTQAPRKTALERVQEIAASDDTSEEDVRRALIGGILTEEFGPAFAADVRFHEMVGRIVDIVSRDEQSRALFDQALLQLQAE
jgi:hypothetical protein